MGIEVTRRQWTPWVWLFPCAVVLIAIAGILSCDREAPTADGPCDQPECEPPPPPSAGIGLKGVIITPGGQCRFRRTGQTAPIDCSYLQTNYPGARVNVVIDIHSGGAATYDVNSLQAGAARTVEGWLAGLQYNMCREGQLRIQIITSTGVIIVDRQDLYIPQRMLGCDHAALRRTDLLRLSTSCNSRWGSISR